jgi:hypothetical protein
MWRSLGYDPCLALFTGYSFLQRGRKTTQAAEVSCVFDRSSYAALHTR